MANVVYIACSLDGFIAREDGSLDWLVQVPNESQSDFGFAEFLSGIDAVILGRHTFETVLAFGTWPYRQPVFVLSNTLKAVPEQVRSKAEIVCGDLQEILRRLGERGLTNLYIDGGKTIQAFLREDLIDEMTVTTVSQILGSGIPLFGSLGRERPFKAQRTELLNEYLVKTKYVRAEPRR